MMIADRPYRIPLLIAGLWGLLLLAWGASAWAQHSLPIGADRYWFLADDVMISMRYGRNLADGLGLVWNAGERVEGYTNFAWVLVMGLVHALGVPDRLASLFVIALNVGMQLLLLYIFYAIAREISRRPRLTLVLAALFLLVDISSMVWGTSGFEATPVALLTSYGVYRILHETTHKSAVQPATFLLIGLIALIRADGVVITALLCAAIVAVSGISRRNLLGAAAAAAPFLLHLAFRAAYYGELAPNTATLKLFDPGERLRFGIAYLRIFLAWYWPLLLLILAQTARDVRRRNYKRPFIFLGCLLYAGYVVYIGGDGIGNNRFFLPILPLVFVLAAAALAEIDNQAVVWGVTAVILLTARFSLAQVDFLNNTPHSIRYAAYVQPWTPSHEGVIIGVQLHAARAPGDQVAVFPAGQVPYFSNMPAIDMLGKSDAHIAGLQDAQGNRPGHNKFDIPYVMSRRPAYVYPGLQAPWPETAEAQETFVQSLTPDFPWLYALFTNEQFTAHCLPYPVQTGTAQTLFRCRW